MFGIHIGNIKDVLTRNPLKFGDALGLTYGPLSGRAPGKLTSTGLDLQGRLNPGVSRTALDSANQIAPWVAAAIAGGALLGGGGAGAGSASAAPAAGAAQPAASSAPAWMKYARLGQLGMGMLGGGGGPQGQGQNGPFGPGMMTPPAGGGQQNMNPYYGWPSTNPYGPNYGRY